MKKFSLEANDLLRKAEMYELKAGQQSSLQKGESEGCRICQTCVGCTSSCTVCTRSYVEIIPKPW